MEYNLRMRRIIFLILTILATGGFLLSCGTGNPVVPTDSDLIRIQVSRLLPNVPAIEYARIIITRTENGSLGLPGRNIQVTADSGNVSGVTDRGDGNYEAVWGGQSIGEITVVASDADSDPKIETSLTFLALEYLSTAWDIPVKLSNPVSTDGWEGSPFLYPDARKLAFSYITLDLAALSAGVSRPIGVERPGQVTPQTLNIYLAEPKLGSKSWWSGWTIQNAGCNLFQATQTHISAPSVTSDLRYGFCTVQESTLTGFTPATIWTLNSEFSNAPVPLGPPVDMDGLQEDNPYYDIANGWLYFDTSEISDPLSKQEIWAARTLGGVSFDQPVLVGGGLNTEDIETQPFVHEPSGYLYFASDREQDEFLLSIWKVTISGDQITGIPERITKGMLGTGRPSISLDRRWFCFSYAREESGGVNTDIAACKKMD
jgi:hypothetical protein